MRDDETISTARFSHKRLQQQSVDSMCVDHLFTRRPGEDCEATVLRRYQGQRVALILDELRRRQVSGPAGLYGVDHDRFVAHYGFCRYNLLNL